MCGEARHDGEYEEPVKREKAGTRVTGWGGGQSLSPRKLGGG